MTEPQPFAEWIGRVSEAEDVITERLAASFRAIFTPHLALGDDAPLGIHWCLSPSIAPMGALGPDGHPAKNLDLPPVPQPRRMWAGGALEYLAPLKVGDTVRRVSRIAGVTRKQGRSGELWFVTVEHEHEGPRGPALRERHDIVYREAAKPAHSSADASSTSPTPSSLAGRVRGGGAESSSDRKTSAVWSVETPPTLLFRYSAITFNGHRIHYDLPYATGVEGYAGLVVHGPIQATLLLNLAAVVTGRTPRRFEYRGVSPAIAGDTLHVRADGNRLWTEGGDGAVHMEAQLPTD